MTTTFKMIKTLLRGDVKIKMIVNNGYGYEVTSVTIMRNFGETHILFNTFDDYEIGCINSEKENEVTVELFENNEGN